MLFVSGKTRKRSGQGRRLVQDLGEPFSVEAQNTGPSKIEPPNSYARLCCSTQNRENVQCLPTKIKEGESQGNKMSVHVDVVRDRQSLAWE